MGRVRDGNGLPQTQSANFPTETEPENYPYESDQTGPENYPPETKPENDPSDQSDQTGPDNYPPQANTEAPPTSENSNQTAPPQQPPVKFPPPEPNNVNGHPSQTTSQVHPHVPPSPYKSVPQQNTTIPVHPVQQTHPSATMQAAPMDWSTGLFDCLQDPVNAVITCFLPCFTFGQIAEIVDNGRTSCGTSGLIYLAIACLIGCPCLYSCTYRTKLRSKFALTESPAPDWLIHCCCEHCALCQEYRELQNRGFDPSSGWIENMSKNQNMEKEVAMAAPMFQTMMKRDAELV